MEAREKTKPRRYRPYYRLSVDLRILRPHIEQQKLRRLITHALNLNLARPTHTVNESAIALAQHRLRNLNPRPPLFRLRPLTHNQLCIKFSWAISNNIMRNFLTRREYRRIHAKVSLQSNRMLPLSQTIRALHDPDQLIRLLLISELLRFVVWLHAPLVGLGPDLKEVDFGVAVSVVFGMPDAGSSVGELHFSALEVLEVAHAVFVLEGAVDDVAEDEELGV